MTKVLIPGYSNYYVTPQGKIYSAPNSHHRKFKEIKLQLGKKDQKDGILRVNVNNQWFKVHRLVAEVFITQPSECNDVKWKDGDRNNNTVENLEWFYNPNRTDLKGVSCKTYNWSKWGGGEHGLIQEERSQDWCCQTCGEVQAPELPSYMFEFLSNEFLRICSSCQAVKLQKQLKELPQLLSVVRNHDELWL